MCSDVPQALCRSMCREGSHTQRTTRQGGGGALSVSQYVVQRDRISKYTCFVRYWWPLYV